MASDKFQQFLTSIYGYGNARSNRYLVEITPPPKLRIPGDIIRQLSFTTESVEIPSQTVSTAEAKINGLPIMPMPNQFSFGNTINISFNLSEDYRERSFLTLWQNLVYSVSQKGFNYYNDYIGQIIVKPLKYYNTSKTNGKNGSDSNEAMTLKFKNCFPVAIQELGFNWGPGDKLVQGATFSFFTLEIESPNKAGTPVYDLRDLFGSDGGIGIPPSGLSSIPPLARFGTIT